MSRWLTQAQVTSLVAATLVLLASVYFGAAYLGTQGEKAQLTAQIAVLEEAVARATPVDPQAQAAEEARVREANFIPDVPGVELMDLVVGSASATGLSIAAVHASSVGTEQVGAGTYRLARVSATVRGQPGQVVEFLGRLEQGGLTTLVVNSVELSDDGYEWQVAVEVAAYAQGG